MAMTIMGLTRDKRTDTPVVYAKMPILTYLQIVGDGFENFSIQRRRETHKAYQRLTEDVKEGALLPSISLAVKPSLVAEIMPAFEAAENGSSYEALTTQLSRPDTIDILDGLQRTYILNDLNKSDHEFIEGQDVLVEFWLEAELENLIYRMIVLNSGQKPMSMRHQIELLFMSLRENLEEQIDGLDIYTERDNARRRSPKKFPLSLIASGYHSFLTSSAELKKDNIVASQLLDANALDASKEELGEKFELFVDYFRLYTEIDQQTFRVYGEENEPEEDDGTAHSRNRHWFADENVFLSFFAAVAQFGKLEDKKERIKMSLEAMKQSLTEANTAEDPLALVKYEELKKGANPRKSNVGVATRRLITNGFKEYFRESGEQQFEHCWELAAD